MSREPKVNSKCNLAIHSGNNGNLENGGRRRTIRTGYEFNVVGSGRAWNSNVVELRQFLIPDMLHVRVRGQSTDQNLHFWHQSKQVVWNSDLLFDAFNEPVSKVWNSQKISDQHQGIYANDLLRQVPTLGAQNSRKPNSGSCARSVASRFFPGCGAQKTPAIHNSCWPGVTQPSLKWSPPEAKNSPFGAIMRTSFTGSDDSHRYWTMHACPSWYMRRTKP